MNYLRKSFDLCQCYSVCSARIRYNHLQGIVREVLGQSRLSEDHTEAKLTLMRTGYISGGFPPPVSE